MKSKKTKLNVIALICSIVMLISCFLPWAEIDSHSSVMGYTSSYNSSVSGIQSGVGFIAFLLGTVCLVMVFFRSKLMIIPGILNLIFSFVEASGMEDIASNVTTSYGEGHAGPSYGIYFLFFTCFIYVIVTAVSLFRSRKKNSDSNSSKVPEVKIESSVESVEHIQIPERVQILKPKIIEKPEPAIPIQFDDKTRRRNLSGFQKALIIIGIIIGVYALIFNWADKTSSNYQQENTQKENNEIQRIELVIEKVNEAVSNKQYEVALTSTNSINWMISTDNSKIELYTKIREDLVGTIQNLISKRDESLAIEKVKQDELAAQQTSTENESDSGDEPPSYPFDMTVAVEKTYLYNEPDLNSERTIFIKKNSTVTIMANQYEFFFCKFQSDSGIVHSGWVVMKDVTRLSN